MRKASKTHSKSTNGEALGNLQSHSKRLHLAIEMKKGNGDFFKFNEMHDEVDEFCSR